MGEGIKFSDQFTIRLDKYQISYYSYSGAVPVYILATGIKKKHDHLKCIFLVAVHYVTAEMSAVICFL